MRIEEEGKGRKKTREEMRSKGEEKKGKKRKRGREGNRSVTEEEW